MKSSILYAALIAALSILTSCGTTKAPSLSSAPAYFKARFETTKGNFEIEAKQEWSPLGVARLYELIKSDYYTDHAVYRVIPDYVAQWGVHPDSLVQKRWAPIKDEPVIKKNTKGTISFARGGRDTRSTILFINLKDNTPRLDTINFMDATGFPVIAEITSGIDVALSLYDGYGRQLDGLYDKISKGRNAYLKASYPKLDYIKRAYIIE